MRTSWIRLSGAGIAGLVIILTLMMSPLQAQSQSGGENTGKGLSNSKSPVDVESDVLEIDEKTNTAVFTGNVIAKQDDLRLNSTKLVVFYEKTEDGGTDVKNMDANGSVVIITATQKITGEWAKFDLKADTVLVGGDVVVTQGKSVIRGSRLFVNQKTGKTRFLSEPGGKKRRVRGLFQPK